MEELSIRQLQTQFAQGNLSTTALSEQYLARIQELDASGPGLNAVIRVNPDAPHIAAALDAERRAGKVRSQLHGIPVLLKDNIDTADKMPTTAGSLILKDALAKQDAFIVQQLRAAGAVILGKTNLSEWANFRSSRSSSGWSSLAGQTRNPYVLDRSPCGSSSGSAVAVSANLCTVAVGTETDGSIVCPASMNGIVGIKPTVGLLSRAGIVPISYSQDTAGPMARSVEDASILLSVLAAADKNDPATAIGKGKRQRDYTTYLNPDALRGSRLGVVRNLMGVHESVDSLTRDALELIQAQGASIIDVEIPSASKLRDSEMTVLLYEFKHYLNAYLSKLPAHFPRSLEDVIAFNEAHHEQLMPYFGQELMLAARDKGPLTDGEYRHALEQNRRLSRKEGLDKALAEHRLDALIAPTNSPAWTIDLICGDRYLGGSSSLAAVAGYPSITVPLGFVHQLPIGLSFMAGAYQEGRLISVAYAFEQINRARRAPEYLPSLPLAQKTPSA